MMMHNIEEVDLSFKTPKSRRNLRIADILVLGDGEEMEQPSRDQVSVTPRRIVSRWFSALKRRRPTKANSSDRVSGGGGGGCGVDSFNLGVACGLLCVVAAGKSELNKMVESRTQMELILQNAKKELPFSTTNFRQASTTSASASGTLQSIAARDECSEGMDELEAELHAELERLQLQLDSENSYSPRQQRPEDMGDTGPNRREEDSASTDCSDEMLWGSGVAPLELERKLHRVLEARREERIKELEDALQCAEQKLQEKEIEVSWWRDTAMIHFHRISLGDIQTVQR